MKFLKRKPLFVSVTEFLITVVGFFDILMVSNSEESRSLLMTICKLAPESTTNSLSSSFMVDAASMIH